MKNLRTACGGFAIGAVLAFWGSMAAMLPKDLTTAILWWTWCGIVAAAAFVALFGDSE